jgi:dTMP kinase
VSFHIAVEGLDGSGKSSLINGLMQDFDYLPLRSLVLPDPECICGKDLINIVKNKQADFSGSALALAFASNRLHQYESRIEPFLEQHDLGLVFSHRYLLSGFVYQELDGVSRDWLQYINNRSRPADLTFFIDTPPELCSERIGRRQGLPELFEQRLSDAHEIFLRNIEDCRLSGWRVVTLDGTLNALDLISSASEYIKQLLLYRTATHMPISSSLPGSASGLASSNGNVT